VPLAGSSSVWAQLQRTDAAAGALDGAPITLVRSSVPAAAAGTLAAAGSSHGGLSASFMPVMACAPAPCSTGDGACRMRGIVLVRACHHRGSGGHDPLACHFEPVVTSSLAAPAGWAAVSDTIRAVAQWFQKGQGGELPDEPAPLLRVPRAPLVTGGGGGEATVPRTERRLMTRSKCWRVSWRI
jgi:hypothetical protein